MTTNEQLHALVQRSGLAPAVALTIFNRGRGTAPCAQSVWAAYLTSPDSERFRPLPEDLLQHALTVFAAYCAGADVRP